MSRYWPSQSARQVSSNRRISRRTLASENPRSLSRCRAIRERLNSVSPVLIACGMPWTRPQRRAVAALDVAVLDVVVDQAEVVAELDGRRAGQRPGVLAGDRGVGEEAEQRPDALAAGRARAVEREVVADHLVQPVRGRVAVGDEPEDLRLGVGDELVEVDVGRGRHRGPSVHETCAPEVADSVRPPGGRHPGTVRRRRGGRDRTGVYHRIRGPARIGCRVRCRMRPRIGGTVARCPSRAATPPMPSSSRASTWGRRTAS